SPSSGEYSTSLCPPILNDSTSSSEIMEHHILPKQKHSQQHQSNTVSALTTLTRKSSRRKNVSFDNNVLDDLFLNRQLLSNGDNLYPETNGSTFGTLPKKNSNFNQPILSELPKTSNFPTLQSLLDDTHKVSTISFIDRTKKPKVPPLLD
ncbi:unnamed protein product, partial [Didymodactylos carnosus]